MLRFGNAKLYRITDLDLYRLRVLAAPREAKSQIAESLLYIGGYDESDIYFKPETLSPGVEAPIFESEGKSIRKAADSFEEWLTSRADRARLHYTASKWADLLRGPTPFTAEEISVVEARRNFSFRVVGITPKVK